MPIVLGIINKSNNFEKAIRYAIAVDGDSDTIGAIVGGIVEIIWGLPEQIQSEAMRYLPDDMVVIVEQFQNRKQN
jgi:ADP-ribosylglycohydrolase